MRKILLNNKRSKTKVNNTNFIPVEINRETSLFQNETLTDTIDILKLYNDEKDSCTKHRFIFTIKPMCTNILFNKITEIVYGEGGSDAKILNHTNANKPFNSISSQPINRLQAIRNTEYSNDIFNYTYHCGLDIFNNHLFRSKEEISVQTKKETKGAIVYSITNVIQGGTTTTPGITIKGNGGLAEDSTNAKSTQESASWINEVKSSDFRSLSEDAFNTIGDCNRTANGKTIEVLQPAPGYDYTYNKDYTSLSPLYIYDTIKTFDESCKDNLKQENGWVGFKNPATLKIPAIQIKVSDIRRDYYVNRCMNNRDACEFIDLAPERDLFSFTPKKNEQRSRLEYNWDYCLTYPSISQYYGGGVLQGREYGLPISAMLSLTSRNNVEIIRFQCPVKHNLQTGNSINLKFEEDGVIENIKCTVVSVGTQDKKYKDRYFSIRKADLGSLSEQIPVGFAKLIQGIECEYYFRKFSKLDEKHDSIINKLGFSNTIYGDEISQIVYTNDINIEGYTDNRGRPLTELYLTIVKTNKGHDKWYNNGEYASSEIEFSHVFGKVSSGLDIPHIITNEDEDEEKKYPSIRQQHNINLENKKGYYIPKSAKKIEKDISINQTDFFGDLVEFNPITLEEFVLEDVYHRFNTAQREYTNTNSHLYDTLYYDEMYATVDDLVWTNSGPVGQPNYGYNYETTSALPKIITHSLNSGVANLDPEGYIYKPHHKIKIGEFSQHINQSYGDDILFNSANISLNMLTFTPTNEYNLKKNDILFVISKNMVYKFKISKISKQKIDASIIGDKNEVLTDANTAEIKIIKPSFETPVYAMPDKYGRCIWKDLQRLSQISYDNELYDTPFTNGAFYHHTEISFPVRRQDPFEKYGLFISLESNKEISLKNNYDIPTSELNVSDVESLVEITDGICF